MAGVVGRPVSKDEILAGAKLYCEQQNSREELPPEELLSYSEDEHGKVRLIKGGIPTVDDIIIYEQDGQLRCSDPDFAMMIFRRVLDEVQRPESGGHTRSKSLPKDDPKGAALPAKIDSAKPEGFSIDSWRGKQDRSYSVAGRQAPNAFAVSEEANRRGLCTQIIDSGRTPTMAWGHVRVTDPRTGQYREDRVSHEKEIFCLLKAWEDANAQARYQKHGQAALIIGIADDNMPQLNPDVKIKGMPAALWLTMAVMRAWSFADRDAITKAERRAQLKILNREWREEDEIQLELEEERAVQEAQSGRERQ